MSNEVEAKIDSQFAPDQIILSRYKIIKQINKGGMGSKIYLAEDISHSDNKTGSFTNLQTKFLAIKVVNRQPEQTDDEWAKLNEEIKIASRVTGKRNIVNTYDSIISEDGNQVLITMEYVKGSSLRETIDDNGCLSVKETIYYFKKLLEAVRELHSFEDKIIHRDLKPENVIITTDKTEIKLIDFGISTVFAKVNSGNTNEDEIYGTYPYITPDVMQLMNAKTIEQKKAIINEYFDIFALGVILYEMLIGEKPFYAENYEDQNVLTLPTRFDFVSLHDIDANIPNALENIVFKCLASKREDQKFRYKSVEEIIYDIDAIDTGNMESFTVPLLKPKSSRMLQTPKIFDIDKETHSSNIFSTTWFYFTIMISSLVFLILFIILIHTL